MIKDRIILKLKSKQGASLMMSLVIFMVATTIAVILYHAALVVAKQAQENETRRVDYYAVSSGTQLMTKLIKESVVKETIEVDDITSEVVEKPEGPDIETSGRLGPVLKEMYEAANTMLIHEDGYVGEHTLTIDEIKSSEGVVLVPKCSIVIKMKNRDTDKYMINAMVSVAGDDSYYTCITAKRSSITREPGGAGVNPRTGNSTTKTIYKYEWKDLDLTVN